MATFDDAYGQNHKQQGRLVLGLSALFLLFAVAPRQERALFIIEQPDIKAFGATLPPFTFGDLLPLYGDLFSGGIPRAFFARTPFGPGTPGGPGDVAGPFGPGPALGGGAPGAPFTPAAPQGPAGFFSPIGSPAGGPGGSFPFTSPSLAVPTASPVAGVTPDVTPPVVTPTPTPEVTPTPTPPVVVPGVPEPTTWATMIVGFLLAGAALRRRFRYSSSSRRPLNVTEPSCDSAL